MSSDSASSITTSLTLPYPTVTSVYTLLNDSHLLYDTFLFLDILSISRVQQTCTAFNRANVYDVWKEKGVTDFNRQRVRFEQNFLCLNGVWNGICQGYRTASTEFHQSWKGDYEWKFCYKIYRSHMQFVDPNFKQPCLHFDRELRREVRLIEKLCCCSRIICHTSVASAQECIGSCLKYVSIFASWCFTLLPPTSSMSNAYRETNISYFEVHVGRNRSGRITVGLGRLPANLHTCFSKRGWGFRPATGEVIVGSAFVKVLPRSPAYTGIVGVLLYGTALSFFRDEEWTGVVIPDATIPFEHQSALLLAQN